VSLGVIAAWELPTLAKLLTSGAAPVAPSVALLALPLSAMAFMLVGLRVAASLPADLNSAWIFASSAPAPSRMRAGLRRTMAALGIVPFIGLSLPMYWRWWGPKVAVTHACLCAALGLCLTEILIRDVRTMPCARPWRPEQANIKKWWPAYVFGFLAFTDGAPTLEIKGLTIPGANTLLIAALTLLALGLRAFGLRSAARPDDPDAVGQSVEVLGLN
jgi:hypothetical protein